MHALLLNSVRFFRERGQLSGGGPGQGVRSGVHSAGNSIEAGAGGPVTD